MTNLCTTFKDLNVVLGRGFWSIYIDLDLYVKNDMFKWVAFISLNDVFFWSLLWQKLFTFSGIERRVMKLTWLDLVVQELIKYVLVISATTHLTVTSYYNVYNNIIQKKNVYNNNLVNNSNWFPPNKNAQ